MENLVRAHAAAYRAIHSLQTNARVGIAHHYRGFKPARAWFPPDRWLAGLHNRLFNDLIPMAVWDGVLRLPVWRKKIREAKGTQDFFGLNYYTREQVAFNPLNPGELFSKRYYSEDAELSDTGFLANDPAGMFAALKWALQFNLPIIITENGVEDADDDLRPKYLIQHLHQVWRAVNFSWPVQGYFHWTLVDNFEWEQGWSQRFGLWELDVETLGRRKRPSADLYARICEENGISSEMVAEFAPELLPQIFPS
jgi:beta-glucosidase